MDENRTNAQILGRDALHAVNGLTRELRHLADRLDLIALPLERGDGKAAQVAAEIVNDYTQGAGAAGARLWSLIRAAADADREFAEAENRRFAAAVERPRED